MLDTTCYPAGTPSANKPGNPLGYDWFIYAVLVTEEDYFLSGWALSSGEGVPIPLITAIS